MLSFLVDLSLYACLRVPYHDWMERCTPIQSVLQKETSFYTHFNCYSSDLDCCICLVDSLGWVWGRVHVFTQLLSQQWSSSRCWWSGEVHCLLDWYLALRWWVVQFGKLLLGEKLHQQFNFARECPDIAGIKWVNFNWYKESFYCILELVWSTASLLHFPTPYLCSTGFKSSAPIVSLPPVALLHYSAL